MEVHVPHWHNPHIGEYRWPVSFVAAVVVYLQYNLQKQFRVPGNLAVFVVEILLLIALFVSNPKRIHNHHLPTRYVGFALTSLMTIANTISAIKLIHALIFGGIENATTLLLAGGSIYLTNVVVFALWYWDLDRGGPGARAEARNPHPDFLFPQMSDPKYAPAHWHPTFFDYLYISITNASAFSPTDAMPLSRWAKGMMTLQSLTSLLTVGLVIARAVNIIK
jgi:uncharacterized membrane protein